MDIQDKCYIVCGCAYIYQGIRRGEYEECICIYIYVGVVCEYTYGIKLEGNVQKGEFRRLRSGFDICL